MSDKTECVYCGAMETMQEPATTEQGWAEQAHEHREGCEWIETRAHTLQVQP